MEAAWAARERGVGQRTLVCGRADQGAEPNAMDRN